MWKVCSYHDTGISWMYYNDHNGYYLTCTRTDYAPIVGSGERDAMVTFAKSRDEHRIPGTAQIMYVPSGKVYNQFGEITVPATPTLQPLCTEGTTRQVKCPTSNKMVTQKCTGNAWVTIKDECKEIITPTEDYTNLIIVVVIIILFIILLRGGK